MYSSSKINVFIYYYVTVKCVTCYIQLVWNMYYLITLNLYEFLTFLKIFFLEIVLNYYNHINVQFLSLFVYILFLIFLFLFLNLFIYINHLYACAALSAVGNKTTRQLTVNKSVYITH